MPKCPQCNNIITSLDYLQYDKGRGSLTLTMDKNDKENEIKIDRPKETIRTNYISCSICKKTLFFNLIKAAKWLITGIYEKEELPDKFWNN